MATPFSYQVNRGMIRLVKGKSLLLLLLPIYLTLDSDFGLIKRV